MLLEPVVVQQRRTRMHHGPPHDTGKQETAGMHHGEIFSRKQAAIPLAPQAQSCFEIYSESILKVRLNMRGKSGIVRAGVVWLIACVIFCCAPVQAQSAVPKYEVDPFWARLPDHWVVGPLGGACIDARDHVFVLHRQEGITEAMLKGRDWSGGAQARIKAPPVMEFDAEGNVVNSWGDAMVLGDYLHDCLVDKDTNVWIA